MISLDKLISEINEGALDGALGALYAPTGDEAALSAARERASHVAEKLRESWGAHGAAGLFSGPGRTEIGGNHTDHQRGHVLCGSVDLDIIAAAAPNGTDRVRVISEGYPALKIDLSVLEPVSGEENTSAALVRGVAAGAAARGYEVGGFDVYAVSGVPAGSGLSSSAAFEVLIGGIINAFFCGGALTPIDIARIGQYAENVFFGKPCGLMDQMGSSVGGAVAIDFYDPADPAVERVTYDFTASRHALCIIDTGSCHADLTDDYADITREMGEISAQFGKKYLRDVPEADFRAAIPKLREMCGERAVLRAMHYYADDRRAAEEARALERGDFAGFLALVNESGRSSELLLQNIWSSAAPRSQAMTLCLVLGRELLGGSGAIRVHGGGFAGTVQAFVPEEKLKSFKAGIEAVFGAGKCHVLHIRPIGGWAHYC